MKIISGIQQIGIGNPDVYKTWKWYRKAFGMDIPIFDEAATAGLMLPYTGGEPQERHAVLAMNINGGGGFEIWQYTKRKAEAPDFEVQTGDLGIYVAKIKTRNISIAFEKFSQQKLEIIGKIEINPAGERVFYLRDFLGNIFQIEESKDWFSKSKHFTGGCSGAIIGVSDIEKAKKLYVDILEYDNIIYDEIGVFPDFANLPGGNKKFRRILLSHSKKRQGAFSELLGATSIELIQAIDYEARKIFENRFWGDLGFIHLCFDVNGIEDIKKECASKGFEFTVDSSNSFDMGEAAGQFSYIEDPDGTLIEFVETHKIPILKKLGWYLNLRKRNPEKALPKWMLRTLAFGRVKD
ncbi:MAG: VOC family protein [Bacteroidetes bacterium]|jgi:catechol 2,3-dioxygenase-like lactoylglutathione lyase family enzyme|nr:VOC family protein [Bacteroidota bacterium]MBT6685985.1 VOC family protein [Bacteroidota bacterium]MBT7144415.1 VOC family protein [Bacteroidota bacterium]MBT7490866.1 VOC family protein [Bacteroidota bacterium]